MRTLPVSLLSVLLLSAAALFPARGGAQDIETEGRVIDIRPVTRGAEVYPMNKKARFGKSIPEKYVGKHYAVSLVELEGPKRVRAGRKCRITVALPREDAASPVWKPTGETFFVRSLRHYLYACDYDTPGEWIDLPQAGESSTLLFGDRIRVAGTVPPPGVVIARVRELRNGMITNPSIVILPDGSYLAACSGAFREKGVPQGCNFFRSDDGGKSWKVLSKNNGALNFYNLFLHRGTLYQIGTASRTGHVVIRRSEDGGRTWTFPRDEKDEGVLLSDHRYHSAPVPVVVHKGRIWRAVETNVKGEPRRAFVISAPEGADLMRASSWTRSEALASDPEWLGDSLRFKQWIEGNVVVAPDGEVVNLLRVDEERYGTTAAMIHMKSPKKASFDPERDIVTLPGGGKKFTVRYDSVSRRYWTLTNPLAPGDRQATTERYPEGLPAGLIRNHLVLFSSPDLREWTPRDTVITSDNPFFDGFQYVDWQFEGSDIVAVIRLAMGEERGLPARQHDANYFVFRRIPHFREGNIPTARLRTLHPVSEERKNEPTKNE